MSYLVIGRTGEEPCNKLLSLGPETIKKSGAWIGAQLTILCSINRKLRSGDYKEIGVRFLNECIYGEKM